MNTPTRFADSTEATEFVEQLQKMLQDPRLAQWCQATDYNFCTDAAKHLFEAKKSFTATIDELDNAC